MPTDPTRPQMARLWTQPWTWPLRWFSLTAFLVVLFGYVLQVGIPHGRMEQATWILVGIVAARLGRPWREHVRALADWVPIVAALVIYDHTRGVADTLGMAVRVSELVDVERVMFDGTLPTVWLQERFYLPGDPQWWDVIASLVYFSHFVVPWAVAAVYYLRSRGLWWRYMRMVLILSYAGLMTYILVPAAPPWYAARTGVVPERIDRNIGSGWEVIGLRLAGRWLEQAQEGVNEVAALPSLHAGFSLLVAVALWPQVRNRLLRALLVAYPVVMALTLVYSGEHYVIDVLLGWAYVAVIVLALRAWDRWWSTGDSAGAEDAAGEVAGPVEVGRPDQEALAARGAALRGADAGRSEDGADRFEFGRARGGRDGLEEAVVGPGGFDEGGPMSEGPAKDQ